MRRRAVLGLAAAASTAGCLSRLGFETRPARAPPVVADRPDAVYVPSHVEGMEMVGTADAGPYEVALTFSFPHRFWLLTGKNRKKVELKPEDSVHLMAVVWDAETGIVPPTGDVTMEIARGGETVAEKPPWPMLSQNMGFHFGDNVALPGDDTYEVRVGVGPMGTRRTGAFAGKFDEPEPASASFSFEFAREELEAISFRRLGDTQGQRGAVDPMRMEMLPTGQLPPAEELPGRALGETTSGDGRFVATALDEPPAGVDGAGPYLAVSARTPYNRYPLPFMGLSATLSRGAETVFEGPLRPTLDPDLQYHYGAVLEDLQSGDTLELEPGAPPQVARHEGYETAFLEMEPTTLSVP